MTDTAPTERKARYYIAAFLMNVANGANSIGIPLLAKHVFGASPLAIGLIAAISAGTYVLFTPLAGRLSDRIGRRLIVPLGVALYCVVYVFVILCPTLGILYLLIIFSGMSGAMFWPILEAAIADGTPHRVLPIRVGIFNASWCSGIVLGSWLGGWLHDTNPRLPFALAVGVAVVLLGLLLPGARTEKGAKHAPLDDSDPDSCPHIPPAVRQLFMHLGWGANFAAWAVVGTMRSLFAPDATVRLGFTGQKAALLLAAINTAQALVFVALTFLHGWRYRFWFLAVAEAAMLIGAGLVAISVATLPLSLGFLMIGLGTGVTYTSSIYYSLEGLHARGARSGIHEAFLGAGVFAAPLFGGWLATVSGDLRAPYVVCVALVALGLMWQISMVHWGRRGSEMRDKVGPRSDPR